MEELEQLNQRRQPIYEEIKQCYKNKDYKKVIELSRTLYQIDTKIKKLFEAEGQTCQGFNNIYYSWSIYHTEIKNIQNESNFIKAINAITKLSKQEDCSLENKPCLYTLSILKAIKYFDNKKSATQEETKNNIKQILNYCKLLNPDFLSKETFKTEDKELPSNLETYCLTYSKYLYSDEQYDNCINFSQEVLDKYELKNNGIWIKRVYALAYYKLNNYDEALKLLNEIVKVKKEWYIQKEIAEIYEKQNNINEAIVYACKSALNFGDIEIKLGLYILLYRLLKLQNKIDEAKKHIEFIYTIKIQNKSNINNFLQDLVNQNNINTEKLENINKQKKELQKIWESFLYCNKEKLEGKIIKLELDKNFGFIESMEKNYHFLKKELKGDKKVFSIGTKVSFCLEDSFDKKKNITSKTAVNINLI